MKTGFTFEVNLEKAIWSRITTCSSVLSLKVWILQTIGNTLLEIGNELQAG